MDNLVIVGCGGFAREVRWLVEEINKIEPKWNIKGWIANEPEGTIIAGLPVLGGDEWLLNYSGEISVVIGIGDGKLRKKLSNIYRRNSNIRFPNIVAPNACIGDTVRMGCGCIVTAQSVLTVEIQIGDFFISNLACTIGHDCKIGNYVTLFPGANISGGVMLEEGVSVGTGACILQGLSIGRDTFIGAGAAVVRNIPNDCVAVGVPAKPLER